MIQWPAQRRWFNSLLNESHLFGEQIQKIWVILSLAELIRYQWNVSFTFNEIDLK